MLWKNINMPLAYPMYPVPPTIHIRQSCSMILCDEQYVLRTTLSAVLPYVCTPTSVTRIPLTRATNYHFKAAGGEKKDLRAVMLASKQQ